MAGQKKKNFLSGFQDFNHNAGTKSGVLKGLTYPSSYVLRRMSE